MLCDLPEVSVSALTTRYQHGLITTNKTIQLRTRPVQTRMLFPTETIPAWMPIQNDPTGYSRLLQVAPRVCSSFSASCEYPLQLRWMIFDLPTAFESRLAGTYYVSLWWSNTQVWRVGARGSGHRK